MITNNHILLTIDVEDWFQVENFKPWIPFETWDHRELRVERNVHLLLDLFDSIEVGEELESREARKPGSMKASNRQPPTSTGRRPRCTFFVLGWLADRLPNLVRDIQSRGHEVASHGYNHQRPDQLSAAELTVDLADSKKRLEDLIGLPVTGYRAPNFAVNDDILKIIEDCGYRYDSSYNSFGLHGRYGRISLNGAGKCGIANKLSDSFYELPISNLKLGGQTLPWGGGGYFRLAPYRLFRRGVQSILENHGAYAFYLHPWEIDPDQPRVEKASFQYRFRHYNGLNSASEKLHKLIKEFSHCLFITCSCYLELNRGR